MLHAEAAVAAGRTGWLTVAGWLAGSAVGWQWPAVAARNAKNWSGRAAGALQTPMARCSEAGSTSWSRDLGWARVHRNPCLQNIHTCRFIPWPPSRREGDGQRVCFSKGTLPALFRIPRDHHIAQ